MCPNTLRHFLLLSPSAYTIVLYSNPATILFTTFAPGTPFAWKFFMESTLCLDSCRRSGFTVTLALAVSRYLLPLHYWLLLSPWDLTVLGSSTTVQILWERGRAFSSSTSLVRSPLQQYCSRLLALQWVYVDVQMNNNQINISCSNNYKSLSCFLFINCKFKVDLSKMNIGHHFPSSVYEFSLTVTTITYHLGFPGLRSDSYISFQHPLILTVMPIPHPYPKFPHSHIRTPSTSKVILQTRYRCLLSLVAPLALSSNSSSSMSLS